MKSWHQIMAMQKEPVPVPRLARIQAISDGGAKLCFADGSVSQKYYKLSPGQTFANGQKVWLEKVCGTYFVVAKV